MPQAIGVLLGSMLAWAQRRASLHSLAATEAREERMERRRERGRQDRRDGQPRPPDAVVEDPRPAGSANPTNGAGSPGPAPDRSSPPAPSSWPRVDWDRLAAEAVAVDLIALLEARGYRPVWKRKDGLKATFHVPWREDRHPSLGVWKRGSVWWWADHARGDSGTPVQVIENLDGVDRKEAIRRLTGGGARAPVVGRSTNAASPPSAPSSTPPAASEDRAARIELARRQYAAALAAMTPDKEQAVAAYWRGHGLTQIPDIGAVWLVLDTAAGPRPYVGIPTPTPTRVRGLECRLLDRRPEDRLIRARTIGPKEIWIGWREPGSVLVAESVLDALSALTLWPERPDSLLALNGVGNVRLLPLVLQQAAQAGRPIRRVTLALDADEAGRKAAAEATQYCTALGVPVVLERAHEDAGVKDLNALLRARAEQHGEA